MAFYTIRLNLGAASFPLLTELGGRTIIVPGQDEHYDRAVVQTTADSEKDKGTPQAYYMENVVPSIQGLQSVGYDQLVVSNYHDVTDFGSIYTINTSNLGRILLSPSGGRNYILDRTVGVGLWNTNSIFPPGSVTEDVQVTVAQLRGETYIYYANYGMFRYDITTKLLTAVPLTGIVEEDIVAICESNGYLVAVTRTAIGWSSLTDPTDFVPSLVTGAGGGNLNEAQGAIRAVFTMAGGFAIYCENNIVSARISSNIQFPFIFTQIPASGGNSNVDQVSWESSIADQFAWTTVGLQQVSSTIAKMLLPEFTDFIAGKKIETFDLATNTFTTVSLDTTMQVALHIIGLRYLVLSYGANFPDYDYAIIYDLVLKRSGKLKIQHRDCIEWNYPAPYGDLTYDDLLTLTYDGLGTTTYDSLGIGTRLDPIVKDTMAFVQRNGDIYKVNFAYNQPAAAGVLLLGKFQFIRNQFITFLRAEFETVQDSYNNFKHEIIPTLDGKTMLAPYNTFPVLVAPAMRAFQGKITGQNYSHLITGSFNLVSAETRFTLAGTR